MSEAHSNLGLAYFELGQIDESLAAHNRALELRPNSLTAKWGAYLTLPVLYAARRISAATARAGARGSRRYLRNSTAAPRQRPAKPRRR